MRNDMAGNSEVARDRIVKDNLALLAVPLVAKRWLYYGNAGSSRFKHR
jgi:hypothetical protein